MQGSFGAILKAKDTVDKYTYCVKLIPPRKKLVYFIDMNSGLLVPSETKLIKSSRFVCIINCVIVNLGNKHFKEICKHRY